MFLYILPTELASLREDISAKEELSQQQASDLEAARAELEKARADLEKMSEENDGSKGEVDRLTSGELDYDVLSLLLEEIQDNLLREGQSNQIKSKEEEQTDIQTKVRVNACAS